MDAHLFQQLLQQNLQFSPEYGRGMSNHRSMALHALHALGASNERLQDFFDAYGHHFSGENVGHDVVALAPTLAWTAGLGNMAAFAALETRFAAMLAHDGVAVTMAAVLPLLWPGLAAAAFHGLIRTAHAIEALQDGTDAGQTETPAANMREHEQELAAALAYWAGRWQAMPIPVPSTRVPLPFAQWTAQLELAAGQLRNVAPSIAARMIVAMSTDHYAKLGGSLQIEADTVPRLGRWIAQRYSETENFTVLHMLTGLRAVLVLQSFSEQKMAVDALKQAVSSLVAAYLASNIGAAAPVVVKAAAASAWPHLITQAIASDDAHDIKLMHALHWFYQRDPDASYLNAASRLGAKLGKPSKLSKLSKPGKLPD